MVPAQVGPPVMVSVEWVPVPYQYSTVAPVTPMLSLASMEKENESPVVIADPTRFELALRFDRETWGSLRADGELVENRIFAAGESLTATAENEFRLSLGHTVGVSAASGGSALRPFLDWASRLEGHLITRDSVSAWIDTTSAANRPVDDPMVGPVPDQPDSAGAP